MPKKKDLILVGGGGHCRACIDVIEAEGKFKIAGIIDRKEKIGEKIFGYAITGSDNDLARLAKKYKYFLVTIGQVKIFKNRLNVFHHLKEYGALFPTIISPLGYVSRYAKVGEGTIIMHKAVVNAGATVGYNCIVNTGAIVEHDADVGDHTHVSTGVVVNGGTKIGQKVFVGSKSVIRENLRICDEVIVGAGAVVTNDIVHPGVYVGQPAQRIE